MIILWICIGILIGMYGPPLGAAMMTRTERRPQYRRRVTVDDLIDGALSRPAGTGRHAAPAE